MRFAGVSGQFINVDVTEIADYGFTQSGTKAADLPELMLGYAIKLRNVVAKCGMRLMVVQCPLDAVGHLNGLGPVLDKLPTDIVVASYYTADFYGGWDKDFPRLQKKKIGLFAMPWINSHGHIMPYVDDAMRFSDMTIGRGLRFVRHGQRHHGLGRRRSLRSCPARPGIRSCITAASAWTGAKLDRDYFNQAFSRLLFGTKDDRIARAILLAGNINGQPIKIQNAAEASPSCRPMAPTTGSGVTIPSSSPIRLRTPRLWRSPIRARRDVTSFGRPTRPPSCLDFARQDATRNRDVLDELLFAARNYQAMGRKLIMRDHYPRPEDAAKPGGRGACRVGEDL